MNLSSKILVIESDQRSGRTLRNFLTSQGFDVCNANNGALGIQKAFEFNPNLIVCAFNMEPIDGLQVFKALKKNDLIKNVPFIFLFDSLDLEAIRIGKNLGADNFFFKPFYNDDLMRSIENLLSKFNALKELGKHEFNALFKLSPNGIFLFDSSSIINANQPLLNILEFTKDEIKKLRIEDIFDKDSIARMIDKLQRCFTGFGNSFSERVILKSKSGILTEVTIYISDYEESSRGSMLVGLIILPDESIKRIDNQQTTTEVIKMLRKENINISNSLGNKLCEVFNHQNVNITRQNLDLFSKRENQVLTLSMEGLPMKLIANKLSISDRTVEKHRARLMEKTGSNNIVEVIVYALRNKLIGI